MAGLPITFRLFDQESREDAKSKIGWLIMDSEIHKKEICITVSQEGAKKDEGKGPQMTLPFIPASGCLGRGDV